MKNTEIEIRIASLEWAKQKQGATLEKRMALDAEINELNITLKARRQRVSLKNSRIRADFHPTTRVPLKNCTSINY